MKFGPPIDSAYDVAWTSDNEFFHAYTKEDIAQLKDTQANGGIDASNEFPWLSRGATLSIPGNVNVNLPLLVADNYRNLMIFQNNSTAISPDVAPDLFISLDGPVQSVAFTPTGSTVTFTEAFNAITLVPGEGLLLDTRVLTNAIYVAWGASVNTGHSVYTTGIFVYGRSPNSPPLSAAAIMGGAGGTHIQGAGGTRSGASSFGSWRR